jgi:signal transduction histidine kinase
MKKATLFLTVFLSTTAIAEEKSACESYGDLAKQVMENRQTGVEFKAMWKLAKDSGDSIIKDLILRAYEQSAYSTEKYQQKATQRFADEVYVACVRSGKFGS